MRRPMQVPVARRLGPRHASSRWEKRNRDRRPTKSRLARIRPRHNKEIEQLRVTESGAGRCTLTQRLGFDLKGGPNELFQIQWPAGINRKDTAKGQCVWLSIGPEFAGRIFVLDFELRQTGSRVIRL